jgi:hypothetical protein
MVYISRSRDKNWRKAVNKYEKGRTEEKKD